VVLQNQKGFGHRVENAYYNVALEDFHFLADRNLIFSPRLPVRRQA
jgi:hypothetical protein